MKTIAMENSLVERSVDVSRGLVEIREYHWDQKYNDVRRIHPEKFGFELTVSGIERNRSVRIIPPADTAIFNFKIDRRRSLFCWLDGDWIEKLLPQGAGQQFTLDLPNSFASEPKFEWILRNIYQEMRTGDFGSALMVESLITALTVEFARKLNRAALTSDDKKGGLSPWRLRRVQQRMQDSMFAPDIAELAEICGLTVRHFARAFKMETGMTPGDYIAAVRAEHARTLLGTTHLTFADIAHRLGFATSSSFSNAFQRTTGLSPRQIERPRRIAEA